MIVPAGKRKQQVKQGDFRSDFILDDIFEKQGIIGGPNIPTKMVEPKTPVDNTGIGDAMSQGGLDPRRHDKLNPERHSRDNVDLGLAGDNASSIAPSGTPRDTSGGSPADRFLGPAPVDPQQQQVDPYEQERQKIRQFVGYQNFGVDLKPGKAGDLEVTLIPPAGTPVDVGGLLQELQKHLGGKWGGESTPSQVTGGPIKFKYIPEGMVQEQTQQKVEKGGPTFGSPLGGKGQVT